MSQTGVIQSVIQFIIDVGTAHLMEAMLSVFILGVIFRLMVYVTVKCEHRFIVEFEKRVYRHLASPDQEKHEGASKSFYQLAGSMFRKTFIEIYELKVARKRRTLDPLTSIMDRVFLVQEGAARIVRDSLKQARYLKKEGSTPPKFIDIGKFVFGTNPVFNRVLGIFPVGLSNDVLSILPGIFIVCGIFGTFLGIMKALPELRHMEISDVEATKQVMDGFLMHIAYAMQTSIAGIMLSVLMTIANTLFSAESHYYDIVNKYASSLEYMWNETNSNEIGDVDYEGWVATILSPVNKKASTKLDTRPKEDRKNQTAA